jgi:hypothetical protein
VLPGIGPIIGGSDAEADRLYRELTELVTIEDALVQLGWLFRTEYEHDTLRGHLGLPFAENRYARSHRLAAE